MYNKGFKFKVTKNNIIGEVNGVCPVKFGKENIYGVTFNDNGYVYRFDVCESTIETNLRLGIYEEI